jgi:4a-hydroxytetrahydrobiopterin dehydratase
MAWTREGDKLLKTVEKRDFAEAMAYVNAVAAVAEAADHHPDIHIRWNRVTLELSSHDVGGVTDRDLALAEQIDALDS